jgi:hypothetical protein
MISFWLTKEQAMLVRAALTRARREWAEDAAILGASDPLVTTITQAVIEADELYAHLAVLCQKEWN